MGSANIDSETGIWSLNIAKKRHKHDKLLVAAIATHYETPKLAADLGCGDGWYCKSLKSFGWPEVHGYDGTQNIISLGIYDDIQYIDLTKNRVIGIDYDFVLCLETGEHIPEKYEQTFLDNLGKFTNKYLVLSWAKPGQYSASGHVNCKEGSYVIDELAKRNIFLDEKRTSLIRENVTFDWFKSVMCFKKQ